MWSFTTEQAPTQAPLLSSPADGAPGENLPVSLAWGTVAGATRYELQVDNHALFSLPEVDQTGITNTTYLAAGLEEGTLYYWRVRAVNGAGVGPWSSPWRFTSAIQGPYIRLTSPNGGEYLVLDDQHSITWQSQGVSGQVAIKLVRDNVSAFITSGTSNTGSFLWQEVSSEGLVSPPGPRADFQVRIYDTASPTTIEDYSDFYFSIGPEEPLQLTYPNGGEVWPLTGQVSISWLNLTLSGERDLKRPPL